MGEIFGAIIVAWIIAVLYKRSKRFRRRVDDINSVRDKKRWRREQQLQKGFVELVCKHLNIKAQVISVQNNQDFTRYVVQTDAADDVERMCAHKKDFEEALKRTPVRIQEVSSNASSVNVDVPL